MELPPSSEECLVFQNLGKTQISTKTIPKDEEEKKINDDKNNNNDDNNNNNNNNNNNYNNNSMRIL